MNKRILAAAILGMASMASAVAGEIAVSGFTGAQTAGNMNTVENVTAGGRNLTQSYTLSFFNGNEMLGAPTKKIDGGAFAGGQDGGGVPPIEIKELASDNFMVGGFNNIRMEANAANAVPEPGSLALLGLGLAGFALSRRRKA